MKNIDNNFWDDKHSNNDQWWLTGTLIEQLYHYHLLSYDYLKNKKILEIGVGLGTCTIELNKLSETVFCSDVSEIALERVKSFSTDQFLSKDLKEIPPVDVAICHLVFQHCTDIEVERIINEINLTDGGIFSFQFAALQNGVLTLQMQELVSRGELFFRDLETIKTIVERSNKEIFYISDPKWWGGKNKHNWYIIKIRNKQ